MFNFTKWVGCLFFLFIASAAYADHQGTVIVNIDNNIKFNTAKVIVYMKKPTGGFEEIDNTELPRGSRGEKITFNIPTKSPEPPKVFFEVQMYNLMLKGVDRNFFTAKCYNVKSFKPILTFGPDGNPDFGSNNPPGATEPTCAEE